ncbi:MAG TPA: tRNA lysidine(34) synthetase TilS [Gemmatimonadales bacterium]|nr:tRNA lysidine(34) synthetase TilS [Gemmatimonadales bacterium]
MRLVDAFRDALASLELEPGPALVAVSGGRDSVVLLDLLMATRGSHGLDLTVAHVDHGINPDSSSVANGVERLAGGYGVPFARARLTLGQSATETLARTRRYQWFEQLGMALGADIVFLAHHADDQAETVLMRALCGSGPAGLAAMTLRQGPFVRPLLGFDGEELERYAVDRGLSWWNDPANGDTRHLRSWVRASLMPVLRARMPDIDSRLLELGAQAAADRAAWDSLLDALPELDIRTEPDGCSVAAPILARYDKGLALTLLQAAARRVGCVLGRTRAARVLELVRRGTSGKMIELGGTWRAELAFDRLRVVAVSRVPGPRAVLPLPRQGDLRWGDWTLRCRPDTAPVEQRRAARSAWFRPAELMVGPARPGERVRPLGGVGRRQVVRCFQEACVPRSRRVDWPVVSAAGEVVWIPEVCRSGALMPAAGTEAVRVDADHD